MATSVLAWPAVALGEVLTERTEEPSTEALAKGEIPIVAKVSFDDGKIHLRAGSDTKTGMILVRPGDLLVSGINAAKGAIAICDTGNTGPIAATIHYGAYITNTKRADTQFLWWLLRSGYFRAILTESVPGGIKTELKASRLLKVPVPLPPLDEQRHIVVRIEELAARIAEAKGLRREAMNQADALGRSILFHDQSTLTFTPMSELVQLRPTNVQVLPDALYDFAGVYSFGRGVFPAQSKYGNEFAYTRLTTLRTGNFVYPKLMAWEGALGVVPESCDGLVVSPEFPVFEVCEELVLPEVLDVYFRTPSVWPSLSGASTGTNVRRRRIQPADFLQLLFPLPPMSTQLRFRVVNSRLDEVRRLCAQTTAELEALLPSVLDKAFRGEL